MIEAMKGEGDMLKQVDFYFDFMSPYSYFAALQLHEFSVKNHVLFEWLPVNLPKLIHQSGNVPPGSIKNKAIYSLDDLKRWAVYLKLPFKMIAIGSFDSRPALRIAGALQKEQRALFCLAVFEALWSDLVDPKQDGWLEKLFELKELPHDWLALSSDEFETNVELSMQAGVFGLPTFILHEKGRSEMFFGVDHMVFLEQACQRNE